MLVVRYEDDCEDDYVDNIFGTAFTYYVETFDLLGNRHAGVNLNVPYCDETMIFTGYDCSLTVVDDVRCCDVKFFSKEVESIPEYILKYLCSLIESHWDKMVKSAKEKGNLDRFLSNVKEYPSFLCGGVRVLVDGTRDDVIGVTVKFCEPAPSAFRGSFSKSYSANDFWGGKIDGILKPLPKIVEHILKDYDGITVNKVCLWYPCAVDVLHSYGKAKRYPKKIFKGISRDFKDMFEKDYSEMSKDAYTVALIICEGYYESNIREIVANWKSGGRHG